MLPAGDRECQRRSAVMQLHAAPGRDWEVFSFIRSRPALDAAAHYEKLKLAALADRQSQPNLLRNGDLSRAGYGCDLRRRFRRNTGRTSLLPRLHATYRDARTTRAGRTTGFIRVGTGHSGARLVRQLTARSEPRSKHGWRKRLRGILSRSSGIAHLRTARNRTSIRLPVRCLPG